MGEVYRATDTRLHRDVAIKVLPADFAGDADRLRRFEQEARATSGLNHPNILTVYDIGYVARAGARPGSRTFREHTPHFSPDGRWIAYGSDESGNNEVYVRTFPASGGKWLISAKGGTAPLWPGDGKELFYISGDGKMMAAEVRWR